MTAASGTVADAFQRATRHHQAGQLQQAEALYRQVLAANPRHADSLHLLGVIALQLGRADVALPYIENAIGQQPRSPEFHNSRGTALKGLGRLADAEASYREALRLRGRFLVALNNLGTVLLMLGRFPEAETCGRKAVRLKPDSWEAQTLLGHALGGLGRYKEAEICHRATVRLNPRSPDAHNNLGHTLSQLGRTAEAEACYREARRLNPNFADAHNNLGCCLKELGRPAEAEHCFRDALRVRPNFVEALTNLADALGQLERWGEAEDGCRAALRLNPAAAETHNTLGSILSARGRLADAEASCRTALSLRPNFALACNNLGCVLKDSRRRAEAEAAFRDAVRLSPNFPEAHNNLGNTLKELGRFDEAEACLRTALRLRSNFPEARVNLGGVMLAQSRYEEIIPLYEQVLAERPQMGEAWRGLLFSLPYIPDLSPDRSFGIHRAFGRAMAQRATQTPLTNDRDPGRRLRIGWLSSDFHNHPVGRNLELFFAHRDRAAFETICYADVKTPAPLTDWFRQQSDGWRSISGLSDAAVAELIREDRIDVMLYLAGRLDHNRPQVAAWRPAPVQISLFDPATSGLAEMDYFISDRVMVPAHPVEQFSERVLRLPNFYLHVPPTDGPSPGAPPCQSGDSVTFGCFHNPIKLNSQVLALWADMLRRVPRARLRFKYLELFASDALCGTIRQRLGSDVADRIDFDPRRSPLGDHLAQYNEVDIALDPFPFNGSTATFEALWMGVPVVTLAGNTFMGRWTASMLSKVGLNDLVATSSQDYVDIAARLAADPSRLVELRHGLREQVRRSAMCNGPRTTRHLERAIRAVWRKWCSAPEAVRAQAAESRPT